MKKTLPTTNLDKQWVLNPEDGSPAQRRGIAMMLVVVSVAIASVMAAAYITSRQNAPQVSQNVVRGSVARSSAETGLSLAKAILECQEADVRKALANNELLSIPVGEGNVKVTITDLDGNAPTPMTQYFALRATGEVGGMKQIGEAYAYVSRDDAQPNPTFSDFAIFGWHRIELSDGTVTRWAQSPQTRWGAPVWMGTNTILASHVELKGDSRVVDTCLQVDSDGGAAVLRDTSIAGNKVRVCSLAGGESLPVLDPPKPDVSMCTMSPTPNVNLTSGNVTSNNSWILDSVRIANTATIRVNSGSLVTRHVRGNVVIEDGGVLIVESDHDFVIDGDLIISNGSGINVLDGVTCRIWVGGNVSVDYGAIGVSLAKASTVSDPKRGLELYKNPNDCQLYDLDTSGTNNWSFDNGSVIVARTYALTGDVRVENGSSYMGSIMGKRVRILSGSVLHYDPCLDDRGGFANKEGPLYDDDGKLQLSALGLVEDIGEGALGILSGLLGGGPKVEEASVGEPSARDRQVKWYLSRVGIQTVRDRKSAIVLASADDSGVRDDDDDD